MSRGRMARNKGARGEREIYKLLQPIVDEEYTAAGLEPPVLQRNSLQSRGGGYDIVGLEWMAPEVKYQENMQVKAWWRQTKRQARPEQTPVLFYRKNHAPWRVVMFGYLPAGATRVRVPVDISIDAFLVYFRQRLKSELA